MAVEKDPMKDALQAELGRETRFIEAVIASAHSKAAELVDAANRRRENDLVIARAQCDLADHDAIEKEYARETQRGFAAAELGYKQKLLEYRSQLAEEVFTAVRDKLKDFAASSKYAAWLSGKVAAYAKQIKGKGAVLFLCGQDLALEDSLRAALPECEVQQSADIVLGGFKLVQGNRLFDETLDAALEEQKKNFAANSRLAV